MNMAHILVQYDCCACGQGTKWGEDESGRSSQFGSCCSNVGERGDCLDWSIGNGNGKAVWF